LTATTTSREIKDRLRDVRIVPVTAFDDGDQAQDAARALMRGGVACIEVTFRTAAAAEAIARAAQVDGMLVGAGTILSVAQLHSAVEAGARFGVAPCLNPDVVGAAQEIGLPFFPGVATPTEIDRARELGIDTVKIFPAASLGGPAFLKAVAAVFPDVGFIPTGGIDAASAPQYLAVASVVAVGGSWVAPSDTVRAGRYDEIAELARRAREALS
jgi:2-dehydro-3-deoxyphosphogluconate aldolase / (4S)-4-hydroxy-2-oxoglutarate aldolase